MKTEAETLKLLQMLKGAPATAYLELGLGMIDLKVLSTHRIIYQRAEECSQGRPLYMFQPLYWSTKSSEPRTSSTWGLYEDNPAEMQELAAKLCRVEKLFNGEEQQRQAHEAAIHTRLIPASSKFEALPEFTWRLIIAGKQP